MAFYDTWGGSWLASWLTSWTRDEVAADEVLTAITLTAYASDLVLTAQSSSLTRTAYAKPIAFMGVC